MASSGKFHRFPLGFIKTNVLSHCGPECTGLQMSSLLVNYFVGGGLIWEECAIVVVDDNFNSGLVHHQAFAEGAGFAHQHAASLAQRAIDRFDDAGLPFAFGARPVLPARQDLGISRQ